MKEYNYSDLNRRSGELLDQALVQPIALKKHGRRQLVILSAAEYDRLLGTPEMSEMHVDTPRSTKRKLDFSALMKSSGEDNS